MRIGIRLPHLDEHVGGGFRFEHELLGGLLARMPGSHHEFVLLGTSAAWDAAESPLPRNASYAPLYPTYPHVPWPKRALRWLRATGGRDAVSRLRRWLRPPSPAEKLKELLEKHGIQFLVHLGPWCITPEIPFLTFVWDLEHRCQPYFPEVSARGEWEQRQRHYTVALRRAAIVVTGTEIGRRQVERFFNVAPDRIVIVPHPTPGDALALAAQLGNPTAPRTRSAEPTFLYPAQFWPHKNHVGLLKALDILGKKFGLRPRLILTGSDMGNRQHVERLACDLGLAPQVRFEGFVARERLLRLYTEVDALVYPSTFGPENLPPLEAFALGCPVAASRIPGAEEQLGDAAVFFDPHDHEGMADAIQSVLFDQSLRTLLIERGRERAQTRSPLMVAGKILEHVDRFATIRDLWP